ncbi:MAG: GxxExxY protein, partial [Pirellulaceae bacterium]|nr:GxxExxY protein [Pirellulaceae bacterium]
MTVTPSKYRAKGKIYDFAIHRVLSPFSILWARLLRHAEARSGPPVRRRRLSARLPGRLRADRFRSVEIEVPVVVAYADFSKTCFLDLVVDHAVYELKTTTALTSEHEAQLLHYLFLLGIPRGKLINFRPSQVQGPLHAIALTPEKRCKFRLDDSRWQDLTPQCADLRATTRELLADWGA